MKNQKNHSFTESLIRCQTSTMPDSDYLRKSDTKILQITNQIRNWVGFGLESLGRLCVVMCELEEEIRAEG